MNRINSGTLSKMTRMSIEHWTCAAHECILHLWYALHIHQMYIKVSKCNIHLAKCSLHRRVSMLIYSVCLPQIIRSVWSFTVCIWELLFFGRETEQQKRDMNINMYFVFWNRGYWYQSKRTYQNIDSWVSCIV